MTTRRIDIDAFDQPAAALESQVQAARRGDRTAFSALYHSRARPVQATLKCLLRTSTPPRDMTADIFERIWRTLPNLPEASWFDAWLIGVVEDIAEGTANSARGSMMPVGEPLDPHADAIARRVQHLAARHRQVLFLRTFFQLSAGRTARALGATEEEVVGLERSALDLLAEEY